MAGLIPFSILMFLSFNLFFNTEKWAFLETRIEIDRNFQSLFWTTEVLQERYWEKFKIQLASDQRQVPAVRLNLSRNWIFSLQMQSCP